MASSRVMASSSPSHTTSDLARFAAGRGGSTGLGSMNVEEILRGIYADMPTPSLAPVVDGGRPMSPPPAPGIAAAAAAPRTAEEVWKEITGGVGVAAAAPDVVAAGGGGGAGGGAGAAEMTLEDFLAREGGAVKEDVVAGPSASAVEGQVVMGFLNGAEVAGGVTGGGRSRKRQLMDPMDRAAMQRQKRMIKNRESAARSRERKQAYIAELESLVMQLEEENAKMFKEQEEQHQKRLKELKEMITPVVVRKMPSRDLRRTNSMQW